VRYLDPSGKSILDTIEGQGSSLFEEFIVPIILKMEPDWSTVNNYYDNSQLNLPRYINNQNSSVIKAARFGGYDLSYNGCEIIAIYNTMEKIRKPQKLCDIISYFENNALGLHSPNAMWGILPERDDMDNYFEQMGCDVEKVNKLDKVDELKENYDAIIVSYWNSSKDKKKGIHTVAVLKLREYQDTWCVLNGTSEGTTSISSIQDFINEKDQSGDKKKFINARGVKLKEGT
jgi:hypothetical protein